MAIAQLLETVGVGGGAVLLVTGLVAVYHLRSIMQFFGRVQTWAMAGAVFVLVILAGEAGLIPGLDPQIGRLVSWLANSLVEVVQSLVSALSGVLS